MILGFSLSFGCYGFGFLPIVLILSFSPQVDVVIVGFPERRITSSPNSALQPKHEMNVIFFCGPP